MTKPNDNGVRQRAKVAWSVVVVYEDASAREWAVSFCDELISRFWAQFEFDVSWWSFASLMEAPATKAATDKAARADLILFSAVPEGDFPLPVKAWIETWLDQRGEREGVLVGPMAPTGDPCGPEGEKHHYLRQVAHRGALDYLTHVPQEIARSIPDSLDAFMERAGRVTSLLEGILRRQSLPPGSVS